MKRTFTFRCIQCERTTSTTAVWGDLRTPATIRCSSCGHRYALQPGRPRQKSDHAYYMTVKQYAERMRLDLATAYSVAEGIIPVARAREFTRRPIPPPKRRRRAQRKGLFKMLFPVLALVLLGSFYTMSVWSTQTRSTPASWAPPPSNIAAPAARPAPVDDEGAPLPQQTGPVFRTAVSRTDGEGRVVEISAADPGSVLLAFCDTGPRSFTRRPLGLTGGPLDDPTLKYGVYRDLDDLSTPLAIRIHKDPLTRRWVTGDGETPVTGFSADMLPGTKRYTPIAQAR